MEREIKAVFHEYVAGNLILKGESLDTDDTGSYGMINPSAFKKMDFLSPLLVGKRSAIGSVVVFICF